MSVSGLVLTLLAFPAVAFGDNLTVSGGLDVRAEAGRSGAKARLEGLFLNLRKVISEKEADRWIVVFQTDSGDNFKEPHLYQTYAQLKGPLGRWNVRAGRYIVPFGLLGTGHDTERLVLRTIEPLSIGLKLDEGVQVHGFTKRFDYAFSLTNGVKEHNPVFIGRIGKEKGETIYGWSLLVGRLPETASKESVELPGKVLEGVPIVRKVRLGFDYTRSAGTDLWRAELIAGTDNGRMVGGGYVELDRSLNPQWSLNFNAGYWKGSEARWRLGAGATRSLGGGYFVRVGLIHQTEKEVRGNALGVQFYYEFARQR